MPAHAHRVGPGLKALTTESRAENRIQSQATRRRHGYALMIERLSGDFFQPQIAWKDRVGKDHEILLSRCCGRGVADAREAHGPGPVRDRAADFTALVRVGREPARAPFSLSERYSAP